MNISFNPNNIAAASARGGARRPHPSPRGPVGPRQLPQVPANNKSQSSPKKAPKEPIVKRFPNDTNVFTQQLRRWMSKFSPKPDIVDFTNANVFIKPEQIERVLKDYGVKAFKVNVKQPVGDMAAEVFEIDYMKRY